MNTITRTSPAVPWAKPDIGEEELKEVMDSFRAEWLSMGPKVKKLEQAFSSFLGAPYAVAVSNGTVALDIALKAIGIGPGDEVIVPAMTYFATASAVSYQCAIPVFVDIEMETFNLDPGCLEEAISKKTKAIAFIDYGGNPANYDEIAAIGERHGIPVLQDAAQSLGALYKGKRAGAQAKIATMSFHMAKVMTSVEGGMVFTYDKSLRDDLLTRRNQGEAIGKKYNHVTLGTNGRMTDLQAAIGLAQLRKLPKLLEERQRVAAVYNNSFLQKKDKITISVTKTADSKNAYFFYPILIDNRDYIADTLYREYGIDTRIAYPMPVYRQEAYFSGKLRFKKMNCPVAESVTSRILDLPIFPSMSDDTIDYVCKAIIKEVS